MGRRLGDTNLRTLSVEANMDAQVLLERAEKFALEAVRYMKIAEIALKRMAARADGLKEER